MNTRGTSRICLFKILAYLRWNYSFIVAIIQMPKRRNSNLYSLAKLIYWGGYKIEGRILLFRCQDIVVYDMNDHSSIYWYLYISDFDWVYSSSIRSSTTLDCSGASHDITAFNYLQQQQWRAEDAPYMNQYSRNWIGIFPKWSKQDSSTST